MRTIPQAWRQEYIKGNRKYDITVNMTLADSTTLTITNNQIWEGGFSFEQASSSDSSFDIGSAIVGSATLILDNINENFSQYDFFNAEFNVSLGLVGANLQPITIGHYTVDETAYNGSLITLSCLDNMWRFDRPFSEITVSYPATARSIINAMCGYSGIGIQLATQSFQGYDFAIPSAPEEDMTCREVLQYVAQATCNYCVINEQGNLELKWYDKSLINNLSDYDGGSFSTNTTPYSDGVSLNGGTFAFNDGDTADGGTFYNGSDPIAYITSNFSMSVDTDDIVITGVKVCTSSDGDGSYDYSWHDSTVEQTHPRYTLVIQDNPFINESNAQSRATTIGGIVANTPLRGFDSSSLSDISIEPGDPCAIIDFRGNRFYSFVTSTRFTTSNSESFSCGVESLVQNKTVRYSNEIKTLVEAKRNAQEVVSEYDQAVQRMQQLAANAGGLYWLEVPQQGGSAIWYESDMPMSLDSSGNVVFTSGSHAWKKTANGFFSCTSTGTSEATTTWTAGIDNNNNAVMNTVSAIGINADWINAGSLNAARITAGILKDQYNYNYWNLNTGEFKLAALPAGTSIYDANADYSGAYVPTNSNAPASSWSASDKPNHVGETFTDTSTNKTYIYKSVPGEGLPKTAHPYANNDDKYWHITTNLTAPIYLVFDYAIETETNYDYIRFYESNGSGGYKVSEQIMGDISTGTSDPVVYKIDSNEFWMTWHTDSSVQKNGWEVDDIQGYGWSGSYFTPTWSSGSLPSATWTEVTYPATSSYQWSEASLEEYIDVKASSDVNLTQEQVFDILTNGRQDQGLYLHNGRVYINMQYLSANAITIGGSQYQEDYYLNILDEEDNQIGKWDKNGIEANAGKFGKLHVFTDASDVTYLKYVTTGNRVYLDETWSAGKLTDYNRTVGIIVNPYREGWETDGKINVAFNMPVRSSSYQTVTQCTIRVYKYSSSSRTLQTTAQLRYNGYTSGGYYGLDYTFDHNYGANAGEAYYVTFTIEKRNATYTNNNSTTLTVNDNGLGSGFIVREGADHRAVCSGRFQGEFTGEATLDVLKMDYLICDGSELTFYTDSWGGVATSYDGIRVWSGTSSKPDYGDSNTKLELFSQEIYLYEGSSNPVTPQWSASDERVKEDIEDLDNELSKNFIDGTQPKRFKFKEVEGHHYGMIAQQARVLLDSLGETDSKLEQSIGSPNKEIPDQRNINYFEYIPHLINYVKDLRAEIENLKAEIKELKGE